PSACAARNTPRSPMCPPAPWAQTKTLSVKKERHADEVFVLAVLQDGAAVDPLAHEAEALVERDGTGVAGAHAELDAGQPARARGIERCAKQRAADPAAAMRRSHRDPERAGVRARRAIHRQHVAPADDLVAGERDESGMALAEVVADEGAHFLERRRLEEDEKAPLARHLVQRRPEARDVLLGDRHDARRPRATRCRTSPPPWPWRAPPRPRDRAARPWSATYRAAGAPPRRLPPPRH